MAAAKVMEISLLIAMIVVLSRWWLEALAGPFAGWPEQEGPFGVSRAHTMPSAIKVAR
jgi:hypothetical protein